MHCSICPRRTLHLNIWFARDLCLNKTLFSRTIWQHPVKACLVCVKQQHVSTWWRQQLSQMSLLQTVKVLGLGAIALGLSGELLGWLQRRLRPARARTLNEVLFFPSEPACMEHLLMPHAQYRCSCPLSHDVETSFSRLLRHLLSASSTLDLCVFSFSNMDLSRAVLTLHKRGLTIRVLTDQPFTKMTGSQIGVLRKAGICVRVDYDAVHMHHKFAVVDGRRLITGSLNWTLQAVQSNKENILVTEEPELVRPFVQEFQKLWDFSDPAKHCVPPH